MARQIHKGEAGAGGRGKDRPKSRQDKATPRRRKHAMKPANLSRASEAADENKKRNQREWAAGRRLAVRTKSHA